MIIQIKNGKNIEKMYLVLRIIRNTSICLPNYQIQIKNFKNFIKVFDFKLYIRKTFPQFDRIKFKWIVYLWKQIRLDFSDVNNLK